MSDVFLSYSRRDSDFVRQLHGALAKENRDIWVDWEDIPLTADWWKEVCTGIDGADTFVFVISPDSVRSDVCRNEIDYAVKNNKRLIPVLRRDIADVSDRKVMHPSIGSHNWIFFRENDDFNRSFQALKDAIDTDLSYVRMHTRLMVRAREWEDKHNNAAFWLQGDDLHEAETWLAEGADKKPAPTSLHIEYITASRAGANARQRRLLAGVSAALVVSLALALLSLGLFTESNRQRGIAEASAATATFALGDSEVQRNRAQSIALAGQAQLELEGRLKQRGVLLALQALEKFPYTWQAERALAQAVQDSLKQVSMSAHTAEINSVTWSPDSKRLATASNDNTAKIWDVNDGKLLLTLTGHTEVVNRAVWSPDGSKIATISADKTAKIWETTTGQLLFTLTGHTEKINAAMWSPDGKQLLTDSADTTARIWDAATGQQVLLLAGHTDSVNEIAWSPDGKQVVSAAGDKDKTAKIWDAKTGQAVFTLGGETGHKSGVLWAAWSPDGARVATASADKTAKIWDAKTGQLLFTLSGHTGSVSHVVWSADGRKVATASADDTAKIWLTATGNLQYTLFGHIDVVKDVAWSPDGMRLMTVSSDGTARLWNVEGSGAQLVSFDSTATQDVSQAAAAQEDVSADPTINSVAWSPDGTQIATGSNDRTARIWQVWADVKGLTSLARGCCLSRGVLTDEESSQFGLPLATSQPPPSKITSCSDARPSRLYTNMRGQVTDENELSLNVRRAAGVRAQKTGEISPNQTFWVERGPECLQDGMAWFFIRYGIDAKSGWVAESGDGTYFVKPMGP